MKAVLSLVALCNILNLVSSSICFWNSGCPYNYFATKTPYNVIRGDIRDSIIKVSACEPHSIWGLFRNGKRHPEYEISRSMKKAVQIRNYLFNSQTHGNCSLCAQDVENIQEWPTDDNMFDKPYSLSNEGYKEMEGIAKRLKQAFPKLLGNLKSGQYILRPTTGLATEESAKGFAQGLSRHVTIEKSQEGFDVFAQNKVCGGRNKHNKNNTNIWEEVTKYRKSSEYFALKDRMQRRTGIDYKLTDEDITALYDLCRYSSSGFGNKLSPWCALFTTSDLQVLEYIEDLHNYYADGYGTAVNEIAGWIPMANLLSHFQTVKMGKGNDFIAYFTQSTMLSASYNALGLFKDEDQLTGANRNSDRHWRSSKISAFSANLVAVLNRCTKDGEEDYNIVFYTNEEPLRSICENGICSWREFEDKLKSFVDPVAENCEV